jgi:hypothetical protein
MMKTTRFLCAAIIAIFLTNADLYSQDLGSTCGYNASARNSTGGTYNHSLFKSKGNESDWWDDMVEEISYSGLDYIAPDTRGYSPNHPNTDAGDPRKLANLCAAMDRRPLDNTFKVAIFDDNAASWPANRNLDKGFGYGYNPPFDCADTSNYKYIWDYDLKPAVQAIPDEKRYKIKGRMVMIFWSVNPPFCVNQGNGHVKAIALMIRKRCMADFGFNPYIVADQSWLGQDPSCRDTSVIDAVQSWFGAPVTSMTLTDFFGTKVGAFCPGFWYAGSGAYMNPNHGQLLINNLTKTVKAGALFTLGEGFSDEEEACALWRSDDSVYYDYPNQRPNIQRRFTRKAFADNYKIEAEACDYFNDLTPGNSGNTYRNGNLDIVKCKDVNVGWNVTNTQAGEWLEWRELPLCAQTKFTLRYSSAAVSSVTFSIDGNALPAVSLPSTGGAWTTIDAGLFSVASNGLHTIRLTINSGAPDLNYFNLVNTGASSIKFSPPTRSLKRSSGSEGILTTLGTSRSAMRVTLAGSERCHLELFSLSGNKFFSQDFAGNAGRRMVPLPNRAAGACVYRVMASK